MTSSPARSSLVVDSPVGRLTLTASPDAITGVEFEGRVVHRAPSGPTALLTRAASQLQEYFEGQRDAFDLPLEPEGTVFQRDVWAALREIPFGETWSYGELARRVGRPRASRAVGAANGQNPIAIVIPCHRVIGADGTLTGYGGGLPRKRWLLSHERTALPTEGLPLFEARRPLRGAGERAKRSVTSR